MSKYLNEYNNISSSKNQNNSLIFAKKLKRENTFTKFSFDPKSIVKHNRYFSNNSIKTILEKTLSEDNNSKNNINMNGTNKIHKY